MENVFYNLTVHVGQPEVAAGVSVGEAGMVDAGSACDTHLTSKPTHNERDILPAEAKAVGEGEGEGGGAGLVGDVVEVAVGVGVFVVDRGREDAVADGEEADDHLGD